MAYQCLVLAEPPADQDCDRCTPWIAEAVAVAQRFNWAFQCATDSLVMEASWNADVLLHRDAHGWSASLKKEPTWTPVRFAFEHPRFVARVQRANSRRECLLKALGRSRPTTILDCTGGTGEESVLLARCGARVTTVERDPVVYTLLTDALNRARLHRVLAPIVERITVCNAVAQRVFLHSYALDDYAVRSSIQRPYEDHQFDVIYCDPMFPPSDKSARVSKTMQFFHHLLGPPTDVDALVLAALRVAQ
ncbi:MAG: class I SAM-dependent methyltransferase, partial [Gammaproteobacteria bacterium]